MSRYVIQGPKVNWKLSDDESFSSIYTIMRTIITEDDVNLEKIVASNNLKPISFLTNAINVARAIAHITIAGGGMASGFMITPDLLLTNNHVFGDKQEAKNAKILFNYQTDLQGNPLSTDKYTTDPESLFHTNRELDYALVRIKETPGMKWGYLNLLDDITLKLNQKINIIQHPNGGPKKIAMNDNELKYFDDNFLQYITDTMPGSSGSPVFNNYWQVIGLHHSGGYIPQPDTGSVHFRNEGIRISAILKEIKNLL